MRALYLVLIIGFIASVASCSVFRPRKAASSPEQVADTTSAFPRSVAEAVSMTLARMSSDQKDQYRRMRRDEVPGLLHGFQMTARHDLGLASSVGNVSLLRSCGSETMTLEDCLLVVLDGIWQELNK